MGTKWCSRFTQRHAVGLSVSSVTYNHVYVWHIVILFFDIQIRHWAGCAGHAPPLLTIFGLISIPAGGNGNKTQRTFRKRRQSCYTTKTEGERCQRGAYRPVFMYMTHCFTTVLRFYKHCFLSFAYKVLVTLIIFISLLHTY